MSELLAHNRLRVYWFLDSSLPDRIPARYDSEQPFESRKLEASVPIKGRSYDRIDSALIRSESDGKLADDRLSRSDRKLLDLFYGWLPEHDPPASSALNQFILTESVAGGMVELERLERAAKHNELAREIAKFARRGVEKVIKESVRQGIWLEVEEDRRARAKTAEAYNNERLQKSRREVEGMRAAVAEYEARGWKKSRAVSRVAERFRVSERTAWRAVEEEAV